MDEGLNNARDIALRFHFLMTPYSLTDTVRGLRRAKPYPPVSLVCELTVHFFPSSQRIRHTYYGTASWLATETSFPMSLNAPQRPSADTNTRPHE